MILKQLIRYDNAPALEATWVETITLPQQEITPGVADLALRTQEVVVKCQAYSNHPEQMAMLRADLGADAAAHEALIAEIEATYVPPEPEPPYVPASVTMRQARLALLGAGLLDDVETAIAALPSPQKEAAKIEWEYSQEVQRHNGFVSVLAPMLGMTAEQTDALFIGAATL